MSVEDWIIVVAGGIIIVLVARFWAFLSTMKRNDDRVEESNPSTLPKWLDGKAFDEIRLILAADFGRDVYEVHRLLLLASYGHRRSILILGSQVGFRAKDIDTEQIFFKRLHETLKSKTNPIVTARKTR